MNNETVFMFFFIESTNNIDEFITMDPSVGVGEIMNLNKFLEKFL